MYGLNAHVMTRRAIITLLEKLVCSYYTQVYKKAHMNQGDGHDGEGKLIRQLNKIWRCDVMNKLVLPMTVYWKKYGDCFIGKR